MSANIAASDTENGLARHLDTYQDDKSEGDAGAMVGVGTRPLERLAAEIRKRFTPDDCHRLAELLTVAGRDGAEGCR